MTRRNIRLDLSYNGSAYKGWQIQKNTPSVQHELEKAAHKVFHESIRMIGVGRTDTGAHAFHYVASFHTENRSIPAEKIPLLLNFKLPDDISVLGASDVPDTFHSRFSAIAREYVYIAVNGFGENRKSSPLTRELACFLEDRLDPAKMRKACGIFVGKHDFRNFCSSYGEGMDYIRRIHYFRVREVLLLGTPVLVFFIKGSGFLRGMIRTMVSVCMNYGRGIVTAELIKSALKNEKELDSKFRVPVPASGLYFKRGYYR